jgi:RecB family endonuclease NucS
MAGRLVAGDPDALDKTVRKGQYGPPAMRLVVARCEVHYTGRLTAVLPEAVRLLVFKSDGPVLVHDDAGGYKPLNCIRRVFRPEGGFRQWAS